MADPAAVLEVGHRVLSREATLREYGGRYQALCAQLVRWILEGVKGEQRSLDDATLAERVDRADQVMDRLVLDAAQAYEEFRTDGPTFAQVCLAHDLWGWIANHHDHGPLNALGHALFAAEQAERPEDAAAAVARTLLIRTCFPAGEATVDSLVDRIEQKTEELQAQALAVEPPHYTSFYNVLYRAAARTTACLNLVQGLQLIDQGRTHDNIIEGAWGDAFRRRVEASRRLADERLVRISEALRLDAEDILGLRIETTRSEIDATRNRDGEGAARLGALERTIHTLTFPRSVEPYLLGEVDDVAWKQSFSEWRQWAFAR